ncbi:MAG: rod shape-determining protein [Gemmatimonadetes bacterium]|nr:rod shape-determining protein [Gemmatimonadota bacterium]
MAWFNTDRLTPVTDVAVDLGTANTLVYVRGRGVVLNEPSVVAIRSNGKGGTEIAGIGLEAKRMLGRTGETIKAVRPLRDGVIADVDVTEMMLRHFLRQAVRKHFFRIRPRMVVGVPSGITQLEKRAVRSGAISAGARSVYTIAEPMAAAIGVGLPVDAPQGNIVIDIGGGTSEIAVIALSTVVSNTSIKVACDRFDEAIKQYIRRNHNLSVGEWEIETLRIQVGSAFDVGSEREMDVKGRDLVTGIPRSVTIHSEEVRECMQEPIQDIVYAVRRALESTPPQLVADIMDHGVFLTGGGALTRGLNELLQHETGLVVHVDDEPLTCVIRGAGRVLDDWDRFSRVLQE